MRPEKHKTYTQVNHRSIMQNQDAIIDVIEDLEARLEAAERRLTCLAKSCEECEGKACKGKA